MNYYEHHIRDYDAATSHLSWEEDLAYTRLLRWYYRKEQPIPASIPEACRQVRAVTKVQKDAVASVLREFFELREDGWHKDTCDEVIGAFQAGEPEREAKKKNEETRLTRHRAERAELFGVINAAGLHLNWNTPIAELRAAAERVRAAAATETATKPATFPAPPATAPATPATATHGNAHPLPTPHSPEEERGEDLPRAPARGGSAAVGNGEGPPPEVNGHQPTAAGLACKAIRAAGIADVNPGHPSLLKLLAAGVTAQDLADTAAELAGKGKAKFALLLATVEGRLRDAAAAGALPPGAPAADPWATRKGVEDFARELGLKAWDETCQFAEYRDRVKAAHERRQRATEGATT